MLKLMLGGGRRTCEGIRRREFLQAGALGLGGLSLSDLLRARAAAASQGKTPKDTAVVFLFLTGGASHIETFDPKMTAPAEYRSVTGEVSTRLPGVTFGGTFPRLASMAHRLAVVRSFSHETSDHTLEAGRMTLQLKLSAELEDRLREAARRCGTTPAEVTIKLLDQHLPAADRRAALINLLDQWQVENDAMTEEDSAANAAVLRAIDEDRLSQRKLFSEQFRGSEL